VYLENLSKERKKYRGWGAWSSSNGKVIVCPSHSNNVLSKMKETHSFYFTGK